MIRGQDVPRPSTLYCRKAPSRHALSFPLLLFFGLTRFVNVQCCAPLDHACSSAFIVCVCVCGWVGGWVGGCGCVCVCESKRCWSIVRVPGEEVQWAGTGVNPP